MIENETIAAMLTPHGGAVAVIAVQGPAAESYIDLHFRAANNKPVLSQSMGRIVYGRWGGESGEESILTRFSAGNLEVHCHGGVAATSAMLSALKNAGCRMVSPWELPAQGVADKFQSDAVRALAKATTERTAAILLDQYRGAISREFAQIEAVLASGIQSSELEPHIERLLELANIGRHLTRPWRVVIAGQPNVGKSSLMNVLAGYERAIVFDAPGTTRDALSVFTAIDGWPVELSDTAGIRETSDDLEQRAIEGAQRLLSAAELVLLVFDLSKPWSAEDEQMLHSHSNAIVVHNKLDVAPSSNEQNRPPGLMVCARTGAGVDRLIREMCSRLVPSPPLPGEAVPFTDEQIERLHAWKNGVSC